MYSFRYQHGYYSTIFSMSNFRRWRGGAIFQTPALETSQLALGVLSILSSHCGSYFATHQPKMFLIFYFHSATLKYISTKILVKLKSDFLVFKNLHDMIQTIIYLSRVLCPRKDE